MDTKDIKILKELVQNSRTPITRIAKRLGISREVINYRISRLQKEGTILKFVTQINYKKLGFIASAIFVKLKTNKEKEFAAFLDSCGFVSWVAELSGIWSFGFSIYGRDNSDLDKKFTIIYDKFKDEILDYRFLLHGDTNFFYEKYFNSPVKNKIFNNQIRDLDKKDKLLLRSLSKNSRLDVVELSRIVNLTAPAVAARIKRLEQWGIIEKFSLFLDLKKLNLMQYSVFVSNKEISRKNKFISYLESNKNISYIAEYLGEPLIEFGAITSNPYMLREVLREIEQLYPENKIFEISMFQKEFISVGLPNCVFD